MIKMINKTRIALKHIFPYLATATCAVLVSNARLFGENAPFSVCLSAVLPLKFTPLFLLTLTLHFALFGGNIYTLIALFSSLIILIVRLFIAKRKISFHERLCGVISFVSYSFSSLLFTAVLRSEDAKIPRLIFYALCAAYVAYALSKKLRSPYTADIHSMAVYAVGISVLCSVGLFGFDLGRSFALLAVLHSAKTNDSKNTALLSVLSGLGCFITGQDMFVGAAFICIAGTLLSFIPSRSFIRQPLYLVCGAIIFAMASDVLSNDFGLVIDVFISGTVFIFTYDVLSPPADRLILKYMSDQRGKSAVETDRILCAEAVGKLEKQMSDSDSEPLITPPNSATAYSRVCMNCRRHKLCFAEQVRDLSVLDRRWSEESVSKDLPDCIRKKDIVSAIADVRTKSEYVKARRQTVKRETSLVDSVLLGTQMILASSQSAKQIDPAVTKALQRRLLPIEDHIVCCRVFTDGSCIADLKTDATVNHGFIVSALRELTLLKYSDAKAVKCESFTRLSIIPKPNYSTDVFTNHRSAVENDISGDVFCEFQSGSFHYFLLCDGMGTGRPAYNAARKLCESIKDMILGGIPVDASLTMASPVMRTSGIDECFATLDLLRLDLFSGSVAFWKAGAAESYILGQSFAAVPGGGYPIGIFDRCYTSKSEFDLSEGGEMIVCSDGAELDTKKIRHAITVAGSSDELAEILIDSSCSEGESEHSDDKFVAVIRVNKIK